MFLNIDSMNAMNHLKDFTTKNVTEKIESQGFEAKLKKAMDEKDEDALKKVCNDFESIFMGIIYKQMKSTVLKSDLVPQSNAQNIFESMLDDELTKETAKAGGIGLGKLLFDQFKKDLEDKYTIE